MLEYRVYVKVSDNCDIRFKDNLEKLFEEKGGRPYIVGVGNVTPSTLDKATMKYKVRYPNLEYGYLNFNNFNKFFEFTKDEMEGSNGYF